MKFGLIESRPTPTLPLTRAPTLRNLVRAQSKSGRIKLGCGPDPGLSPKRESATTRFEVAWEPGLTVLAL